MLLSACLRRATCERTCRLHLCVCVFGGKMPLGSPAGTSAGKMFQEVTANLSLTADTSGDVTAAAVLELEMGKNHFK